MNGREWWDRYSNDVHGVGERREHYQKMRLKYANLPEVTLSAFTEAGELEPSISILKQRTYTGRDPIIPSSLADIPCICLGVEGILAKLNTVLGTLGALGAARIPTVTCVFGQPFRSSPVVCSLPLHYHVHLPSEPRDTVPTSYNLAIGSASSLLEAYILKGYDFGTVFSHVRPFWYNDLTDIQDKLHSREAWDQQMRRDVLVNNKIISRLLPPRRVWDLYSNKVVPWWVARQYPSAISHAWMEKEDRMNVQTPINGYEWPVPMQTDANLDLIRIEMLNLGAEYVWLNVLCLRQASGQKDDLHLDEWKLDVPTIGRVYRMAHGRLVCYFSGLGRPLSLNAGDFESDTCWFRRAWTLQEIQHRMIIGGDTDDDRITEKEMRMRIENQLSWLRENKSVGGLGMPVFIALSEMQKRVSTNPVDKVAGLSYLLWTDQLPTYYATQSQEEAWRALVDEMNITYRGHMFFLYPKAGNGNKCWRPSWKQTTTEALPPPHLTDGWVGFVLRTKENDADWCDGPCIESGYVRGLAEESPEGKRRHGELAVEGTTGVKHTFKIVAAHQYPIPEGLYALVGSNPCGSWGTLEERQCWVVGERLPGQISKKVSVFMMANKKEVKRLHDLGIATSTKTFLA